MTQFYNAKQDIVQEAIDGALAASNGRLERLDGYPFIRVVKRADWDKSKVAIISGGGSGHEPAHAGLVGEGMLTAAVCGDVFASPSVDAVLAAILSVTGDAGCLLVVKSYTGDRLNFGLATERARSFGLKVEIIFVEDDIALPDAPRPRGLAGTLLIHKIAGEISEAGGSLEDVATVVRHANDNLITIGMSLGTCTVPGSAKEDRIPAGKIELGLGIHGEAGAEQIEYVNAKQAMADAASHLKGHLGDENYVALVNNLGGMTSLEMSILTRELQISEIGAKISHIIGPAPMMTALDMHGFSITLYPLNIEDELRLAEPSPLPAWPGMKRLEAPSIVPLPEGLRPKLPNPSDNATAEEVINKCCKALIAAEADLNALDAKVGDGDTGSTLSNAAKALLAKIGVLPLAELPLLLRSIGQELSQTMGGSSGVILAIFFSASADAAADGNDLPDALTHGLARIKEVGGAQLGDRTMIDALEPALNVLGEGVAEAAQAAREGANKTAHMDKANAGRASYIGAEHLDGVIDPGAEAVARLMNTIAFR